MTAFTPLIDWAAADLALQRRLINCLYGIRSENLSDVEIVVHDRVATLRGRVPNARIRHLARECCRHAPGVQQVQNQLVVDPSLEAPPLVNMPTVQPPPYRMLPVPAPHYRRPRKNLRLQIHKGYGRYPR